METFEILNKLYETKRAFFIDVTKHFMTLGAGLIVVLVSLANPSLSSTCLFQAALLSLSLCILSGSVLLVVHLKQLDKMGMALLEDIILPSSPDQNDPGLKATKSPYDKMFRSAFYTCLASFLAAMACLVIYRLF